MTAQQLALADEPGRPRPTMGEEQLLAAVRKLAHLTGWLTYHTHDSRRSERGYPDLTLVHDRQQRTIFAELKTDTGTTTVEQEVWLTALHAAGQETALWRPADLPDLPTILRGDRRLTEPAVPPRRPERQRW